MTTRRRWLVAASVLAVLVVLALAMPTFGQCDGDAPGFVDNQNGCATWSLLDYAYPWNWGLPDQCLGLCPNSLQ